MFIRMEYSLSDIQLPDPPKEKDASENLSKSSKEVKLAKLEKNHVSKNEGKTLNARDDSNGVAKNDCEPSICVTSEVCQKDHTVVDASQPSEKNGPVEVLKNTSGEGNNIKTVEMPSVVEESTDVQETGDTNDVDKEIPISENCDSVNATNTAKQSETPTSSKKSSNPTPSNASKTEEQQNESEKNVVPTSRGKHTKKDENESAVLDKESAKIIRKRKNRRTSRSSSRSSSSSSCSSPERESSRSKKSGKSGSSSEGIASPSSSGSSSGSESEEDKNSFPSKKCKTEKTVPVIRPEEVTKPRRKINRNLAVKSIQENIATKDAEEKTTQESGSTSDKVKKNETDKSEEEPKKAEVREIKFTPRKLSLTSLKSSQKSETQDSEKSNSKMGVKKRKWGNCTAALPRVSVSISSDSLRSLIPDLKPFTVAPVLSDQDELSNSADMEPLIKKEQKIVNLPTPEEVMHEEIVTHPQTDKVPNVADVKDVPAKPVCVSPAHNPTSNLLFIRNLVRPFTLLQLKELLKQTGSMVEESFWIDKIKSKCIVEYETEDQAVTTRAALHGNRWPLSNPKILAVDFSTKEELDSHRNMNEQPKPSKVTQQPSFEKLEVKESQSIDLPKRKNREEHKREKERQKLPVTHVREWDKDKLTQDSPDQATHRVEKDAEKPRSDKRKEKKDSKRRVDEDAPAKLLDDLFRKTRASPCIYWLPLTEEQAKQREDERHARRVEREKRWQQRKEQEENERRNRTKGHSGREKENRRSQSRSRSPQFRRR